jgi:dipeptidyl aminopeptidase/acylaminoacyl peptidase
MKYLWLFIVLLFFNFIPVFTQTGDLLPADNLAVDGIPPIPASIVAGVGRYTEFRSASLSCWHPSKVQMIINTRFADVPQLHEVKFPGGARIQLTFFKDRVGGATYPPKRDDYFVFSKDVGGGEWYQLYRYDVASGEITLITDGKSRNALGAWNNAGDKMVYCSTKRNGKDYDFYIIDPMNPSSERMLAQLDHGEAWNLLDWSPDDSKILAVDAPSINEAYLWLFDAATGEKTLLTPQNGDQLVSYGSGAFSKDGKGIYVTTDKDAEFSRLAYFDLATKKYTYLSDKINWDVNEFAISNDGKHLVFITNEDGISVVHMLNTATNAEEPFPKLPIGVISGIQWHSDNAHIGFNINSARSTTDVYSVDIASGNVERWTTSETGGLNISNFSEPELIRWKTFDGKTISGFLYKPPAKFAGKHPVVINIHGGPEGQATPGFLGRNNYYINELGVAMIYPNVRGSTGYGKTFSKLDNGLHREDTYKDIDALLDWIKNQPDLDGDRIMVTGGSYGGHMTFAIATYYSDKIRCAVSVVGISNFITFLEHTEAYRRDLRRAEYGDERDPKIREFFQRTAPSNNADKIKKPMFIIQGKNDPRVPVSEAEQMVATLKKNGTPVWSLIANDEGHGFAKKKNQDYQFYSTVLFMKEYLLK